MSVKGILIRFTFSYLFLVRGFDGRRASPSRGRSNIHHVTPLNIRRGSVSNKLPLELGDEQDTVDLC